MFKTWPAGVQWGLVWETLFQWILRSIQVIQTKLNGIWLEKHTTIYCKLKMLKALILLIHQNLAYHVTLHWQEAHLLEVNWWWGPPACYNWPHFAIHTRKWKCSVRILEIQTLYSKYLLYLTVYRSLPIENKDWYRRCSPYLKVDIYLALSPIQIWSKCSTEERCGQQCLKTTTSAIVFMIIFTYTQQERWALMCLMLERACTTKID